MNCRCVLLLPAHRRPPSVRVAQRALNSMTISADQIRQARKLLGWHRGDVAIRARGITGNTVGKAEGAFPGSPPTPEQLQEIRGVLEAAGIEFTIGTPGVKLRRTGVRMPD